MREPVPVEEALNLYRQTKSWQKVVDTLRRSDGSKFTYRGLYGAVRAYQRKQASE